jgi:hypothetical protein
MGDKEKILDHFNGDYGPAFRRYIDDEWKHNKDANHFVKCPFHGESNASFSADFKKGIWHCFGCQDKGDIFSLYARVNSLDVKADFPAVCKGIAADFGIDLKPQKQKRGKLVAKYQYTDKAGKLLFTKERYENKDFLIKGADGRYGLRGIGQVLYNLPNVVKSDEVIIVEGEKDADNLNAMGFCATCEPVPSGKWVFTNDLAGKKVIILPDADGPGRDRAQRIAQLLHGKTKNLKVVELPGLPDKGDVTDYIKTFNDADSAAEALSTIIEGAEPWQPAPDEGLSGLGFEFIHNAQILENLKPIQWRIHGIIEENCFYSTFGDVGNYKSYVELDRLLCIAAGIDYHGHPVKQGTVFYIMGEGQQGIGRRVAAWHIQHKTRPWDVPFFIAKKPTRLMDKDAVEVVKRVVDIMCKEYGPPANIQLDTLARNFGAGNENATEDMNQVVQNIDSAFGRDIGVGITHHTGQYDKTRARGSIVLKAAVDAEYQCQYRAFNDTVLVTCTKMKDAPPAQPMVFSKKEIILDIEGQRDTSLVLELDSEGDDVNIEPEANMSQNQERALELLKQMYAECEKNLEADGRKGDAPHIPESEWCKRCVADKIYTRSSSFNRAAKSLFKRNCTAYDKSNYYVYPFEIYKKYELEIF